MVNKKTYQQTTSQVNYWLVVYLPLWKILVSGKDYPIYEEENKTCLKPPTSYEVVSCLWAEIQCLAVCESVGCTDQVKKKRWLGWWWVIEYGSIFVCCKVASNFPHINSPHGINLQAVPSEGQGTKKRSTVTGALLNWPCWQICPKVPRKTRSLPETDVLFNEDFQR